MKKMSSNYCHWRLISDSIHFVGYASQNNKFLTDAHLYKLFSSVKSEKDFTKLLNSLSGCFAIYASNDRFDFAAVDRARSYPLFLDLKKAQICKEPINNGTNLSNIEGIKDVFGSIEYMPMHRTFLKDFIQLQAGQYYWNNKQEDETSFIRYYFRHFRKEEKHTLEKLENDFNDVLKQLEQNLAAIVGDKTLMIPLSGGFDSRLILAMAVNAKLKIIAFTYGQADRHEAITAKAICDKLSIKWHFIPYTEDLLKNYFSIEWEEYANYASKYTSLPQEQEFFAVKYLHSKNLIPDNAIFCPGFCGDVQAGSYLPDKYYKALWKLAPKPISSYLSKLFDVDMQQIIAFTNYPNAKNYDEFISQIEEYILREKEAKYIINGVRCYEYFGFDWYLPLWEKSFILFWQQVDSTHRYDRRLYKNVLNKHYFEPLGIGFEPVYFDAKFSSSNWRTLARYLVPKSVKSGLKTILMKKELTEVNNFNTLSQLIAKHLNIDYLGLPINKMNALWTLKMYQRTKGKGNNV